MSWNVFCVHAIFFIGIGAIVSVWGHYILKEVVKIRRKVEEV
jgi:hypothetical protein